jgi:hypothetical protein
MDLISTLKEQAITFTNNGAFDLAISCLKCAQTLQDATDLALKPSTKH